MIHTERIGENGGRSVPAAAPEIMAGDPGEPPAVAPAARDEIDRTGWSAARASGMDRPPFGHAGLTAMTGIGPFRCIATASHAAHASVVPDPAALPPTRDVPRPE